MTKAAAEPVLADLTAALAEFTRERDWERYHSPKNFAMALAVEVGEVMEHLMWVGHEESRQYVKQPEMRARLESELGDVMICVLQLARLCDIDAVAAAWTKLEKIKQRYTVEGSSGEKFTKLAENAGTVVKMKQKKRR